MEKELGLVAVQQLHEALKAPVRERVKIVDPPRGRVGHQNIKAPLAPEPKPQPPDALSHLPLGVHVLPAAVAVGAAEAQNPQTLVLVQAVVDADAALRLPLEAVVVVAVDIEQRAARHRHQKLQIGHAQVPAGNDQVIVLQLAWTVVFIEVLGLHIRNRQDLHSIRLLCLFRAMGTCRYQSVFVLFGSSPTPTVAGSTPAMSTVARPSGLSSS